MILQFGVEFQEFYELIISAWAITFSKQQSTLDLHPQWFAKNIAKLPSNILPILNNIRRLDGALWYALLLNSPVWSAKEFLDWLPTLSDEELFEMVYSFNPKAPSKTAKTLLKDCQTVHKGLSAWYQTYFSQMDTEKIQVLEDSVEQGQSQAAQYENRPQDLIRELTQSIIWEADGVTEITLIPHLHLSPWSLYEFGADHGVIFYPYKNQFDLHRTLKAVADESRMEILRYTASEVKSFTELVDLTGLAKSTVHHHIITLRAAGLLWLHVTDDRSARFSVRWDGIRQLSPALEESLQEYTAESD